jgi:antirestriction protein ArdC
MTYRQAQLLGAQVRKGERGTTIVYAKPIQLLNQDAKTDDDNACTIPLLKAYTVFNVAQIDGLPAQHMPQSAPETIAIDVAGRLNGADAFVTATGAHIQNRGNRARYIPGVDRIDIPPYAQFRDTPTSTAAEGYYAILLHELIHNAGPSVMPRRSGFARKRDQTDVAMRHNQGDSRKLSRASSGLYRPGRDVVDATRARAFSLRRMSACM